MGQPRGHEGHGFRIVDAMLLVAATAAGLALAAPDRGDDWRTALIAIPLAWAAAIVGLSWVRGADRRALRRGAPGLVACLALLVAVAAITLSETTFRVALDPADPRWFRHPLDDFVLTVTADYAGGSIAASWLVLILTRRWRPVASWPDRLGRCLGGYWLLLLVVSQPFQHFIRL